MDMNYGARFFQPASSRVREAFRACLETGYYNFTEIFCPADANPLSASCLMWQQDLQEVAVKPVDHLNRIKQHEPSAVADNKAGTAEALQRGAHRGLGGADH